MCNARRTIAAAANQHHVRDRYRALLLRDATLDVALRIRAHMLLHHRDVLYQDPSRLRDNAQHASLLACVAAGDHLYGVAAPDIDCLMLCRRCRCHFSAFSTRDRRASSLVYRTSGASETIFKNFFSRSSRATGPNTRVPTGSPVSLISTAAF